jgi:hypothetical protein
LPYSFLKGSRLAGETASAASLRSFGEVRISVSVNYHIKIALYYQVFLCDKTLNQTNGSLRRKQHELEVSPPKQSHS